jgi:hypothetical protein
MKVVKKNKPLLLRWMPSLMYYIERGKWNKVERLFERIEGQGYDGIYLPTETSNDVIYSTSREAWDYGALKNGHRPHRLTKFMQRKLFQLINRLNKYGMVCGLVIDHTLHRQNIPSGTLDHCMRQIGRWLRAVDTGQWDPDDIEGIPDPDLAEEFSHLIGKPLPIFVVFHDRVYEGDTSGTVPGDIHMQFKRWRRWYKKGEEPIISKTDPGNGYLPEQWPEGQAGTTTRWTDFPDYPIGGKDGADYVDLYPKDFPPARWQTYSIPLMLHVEEPDAEDVDWALNNNVSIVVHDGLFEPDQPLNDLEKELTDSDEDPPEDPEPPSEDPVADWIKLLKELLKFLESLR